MQGWRDAMEDAHVVRPSLLPPERGDGWGETALFAVMDGHGGEQVARFCELHLPGEIARGGSDDIPGALRAAFVRMDEMLADPRNLPMLRALSHGLFTMREVDPYWIGCTAVVCCVCHDRLVVANAGDSRAVLCRDGKAVELSEDHKPDLLAERTRILNAGGCVLGHHLANRTVFRVNGDLSLSRSIGDLRYKTNSSLPPEEQMVSSVPDVKTFRREATDEFMVVACDGIWDVLSSQQVVDFVRLRLEELLDGRLRPSEVVEELLDECLSPDLQRTGGLGGDNMTMILVVFAGKLPMLPPRWHPQVELPALLFGCGPCTRKVAPWA